MRRTIRLCSTVIAAALLASAVPSRAQSLAEIASKEAARRKSDGKPAAAKVYNNDDLKPAPAPSSAVPAAAPAAAPVATAKQEAAAGEQKAPEDEKGETYWRNRMSQAREEIRRNEMFRDALQTRINSLSNDFAARDDPGQRAQLAADRQKAVSELARVTGEIERTTKKIADMEEEARQAGVPPGWLR
jgi:hypothetical protein